VGVFGRTVSAQSKHCPSGVTDVRQFHLRLKYPEEIRPRYGDAISVKRGYGISPGYEMGMHFVAASKDLMVPIAAEILEQTQC